MYLETICCMHIQYQNIKHLVCRLGRVSITRHLGIDCAGQTASRAFYAPLTVKTQKKCIFLLLCNVFIAILLHCVKIDLKNTQDVSFHVFRMNKRESIPRCLIMVTHPSPKPGASKHFKHGLLYTTL